MCVCVRVYIYIYVVKSKFIGSYNRSCQFDTSDKNRDSTFFYSHRKGRIKFDVIQNSICLLFHCEKKTKYGFIHVLNLKAFKQIYIYICYRVKKI